MKLAHGFPLALALTPVFTTLAEPVAANQEATPIESSVAADNPAWAPYLQGAYVQTSIAETERGRLRFGGYLATPFAKTPGFRATYPGPKTNLEYCAMHADFAGGTGTARIVSRETGEPVPGATVFCFEKQDLEAIGRFDALLDADGLPPELLASRTELEADQLGIVHLAGAPSAQLVVAVSGDQVGFGVANWAHAFGRQIEVDMAKPKSILVQVSDLSGRADGAIPVKLEVKSGGTWRPVFSRFTGGDGVAKFGFANLIAASKSADRNGPIECRILVSDIHGIEAPFGVDWAEDGPTRIEAKVDLGVEVNASLVDPLGLALTRRDLAGGSVTVGLPQYEYSKRVTTNTGAIPLGRMPRGAKWGVHEVRSQAHSWTDSAPSFQVTKELVASEHVDILVATRGVVLLGRLVDADGAGLANQDVFFQAETDVKSPSERLDFPKWPSLRTDGDGRFLLRMSRGLFRGKRGPDALSRLFLGYGAASPFGGETQDLTNRVSDPVVDLGDIPMARRGS